MRIVAAITMVAMLFVVSAVTQPYLPFYYLAGPIFLAVGFVVLRRHSPGRALITGALVTFGIVVSVGLSFTLVAVSLGEFDNCDGLCVTNSEEFVIATILLLIVAAPIAVVGGLVSALASYTLVRPAHSNQL
ncbi:MAG: hypothetical protein IIC86_08175 [Chloroflexi bacterium]|nr:hypothetical protein [Chloroflexota bacterium]